MRFGIREICNVVFRAKAKQTLGSRTFFKDEPVLYFDTLKTSTIEGAATSVYAQGGPGNPRLVVWEGERTVTFTMEDALISKEGLAILTGAGLIDAKDANSKKGMFVHQYENYEVMKDNEIVIPEDYACWNKTAELKTVASDDKNYVATEIDPEDYANNAADIFVMVLDDRGNITVEPCIPAKVEYAKDKETGKPVSILTCYGHDGLIPKGSVVLVDYYVKRMSGATQIEITADKFGGAYYIEADTLFRREGDNVDMPANFIIPNGKVQSNFNFAMAATGDPSTFTFTVDALPDYTKFDRTHKVLVAIQMIEEEDSEEEAVRGVCFPRAATTTAVNATIKTVSNTEDAAEIEVTGTNVKDNFNDGDNKALFNMYGELAGKKAMALNLNLPVAGKTIRQVNPALEIYKSDTNVHDNDGTYVKTKTYPGSSKDDQYALLITGNDEITVEVYQGGTISSTTGDVTGGTLEKTFTITPDVTFA